MTWKYLDAFPRMWGDGAIYRLNIAMSFGSAVAKQPSGARQSHIFAKEKMGGKQTSKAEEGWEMGGRKKHL